jgi:hypothetical protein
MAGRRATRESVVRRLEGDMNPVPNDVLLPCRWLREEFNDDRMEFRRDDDRLTISAVRRGSCPPLPEFSPCRGWELRCRQYAGEASNANTVGYVTTREVALDTVLRYMERINEAIGGEVDLSLGAMIDLLGEDSTAVDPDDRKSTTKRTAEEPSP